MAVLFFALISLVVAQCPALSAPSDVTVTTLPYYADFEIGTQNWATTSQSNASCASWTRLKAASEFNRTVPSACHSGVACWSTGVVVYNANEDSAIVSPRFNFSQVATPPVLTFWIWHDTVAVRDGLFVETSSDGTTWTSLGDASWYGGSALVDGKLRAAFSGKLAAWRLVSRALPSELVGQQSVWLRLRFVAGAVAPRTGGVLIDDIVVSLSAVPACPVVTSPALGAGVSPLPFQITWNPVAGVPYYDVRYAPEARFVNASAVGAGVATKWLTPANADGVYLYQVLPRLVDNTTNPFCAVRSFSAGVVGRVVAYPYTATFDNGNEAGWSNVDYDTGRVNVGAAQGRAGVAFTASPGSYDTVVYQSPPFDFSKLRSAILSFELLYGFASGGATIQFSNTRGQSWHNIGAPGAGANWYTSAHVVEMAAFLNVPAAETPGGWTGSRTTFAAVQYSINSATMARGAWVPCHPEVYFRFVAASGAVGGGTGLVIDNLTLRPDPADPDMTCGPVPTFSQNLNFTPAPTPIYVAPPTTTSTTTTTPPTTVAPTTPPTTTRATSAPTSASTTLSTTQTPAPTPVGATTPPPPTTTTTTLGSGEPTPAPTPVGATTTSTSSSMPPRPTDATFAPTPVPASLTQSSSDATTTTSGATTTIAVEMSTSSTGVPPWVIAIIVLGCLLCCLLLLLLAFLLRRKQKEDEKADAADDDSEVGRPSEDDDPELGRAD